MIRLLFILLPAVFCGLLAFVAALLMGFGSDDAGGLALLFSCIFAGIGWSATVAHPKRGEGNPHDPR